MTSVTVKGKGRGRFYRIFTMDCMINNESVCSVKKEGHEGYYRIHTVWMSDRFRVNIASKNASWTGEMSPENIRETSKELNMDDDKYVAECKEALTTDDGKKGYSYAVENGSFTWKRIIDEDSGMRIKMGSIIVQPTSFVDTIQNMNELLLTCKKNLLSQVNQLLQQKEGAQQRICRLQTKLQQLNESKLMMETDVYSKFLLLLNTKKRKIKELKSSLVAVEGKHRKEREATSKVSDDSRSKMTTLNAYDMDTDEEEEECADTSRMKPSPRQFRSSEEKLEMTDAGSSLKSDEPNTSIDKKTSPEEDQDGISRQEKDVLQDSNSSESDKICGFSNHANDKSFPKSKIDILDFFFGSNEDNAT